MNKNFDPSKVISFEKISHLLPDGDIEIGEIVPDFHLLSEFTKIWTGALDFHLQKEYRRHHEYTVKFQKMIGYRGITYDEFLGELLNNIILENDFRKYKTFLFLQIATNVQRQNTLLRLPQNKEDSYTALLLGTKFFEVQSFFFRKLPLRIKYDDIKNHEITFGQAGSGKSTYISLKVYQIQKYFPKTSVICLDGGGDLSKLMMRFDLNKDSNRMVFISPSFNRAYSPIYNPFQVKFKDWYDIDVAAQFLAEVIADMVDDDLTRGMLSTLHPVLCALIAKRDATFEDLARFFDEKDNADLIELGMNNPNPSHKAEISRINEGQNNQTRNAMRRRINSFLSNHMFRDFVIGKTSFDLEELMNTGKIVIFHLPIGEQGGDTLKYIGKMIIAQVKYFGFRRIKIEESHRPHTCFIIDECQYFLSKSLVEAYTQLRRFKVFMHIATQSAENLETLKDKAITNSGIKTTGHVDSQETKNLIHRACGVSVEELTSLRMSELEFYVKSFSYPRGYRCKLSKMFFDEVFLLNDAEYNAFSNYQIEKYYTARAVLQQADNLESRKPNRDDSKNDDKPLDLFLPDDLPTKP